MDKVWEWIVETALDLGPKLLIAAVILLVGYQLTKLAVKLVMRFLRRANVDVTLHAFIKSAVTIAMMLLVIVTVCATMGINMTSIITAIGAAGVAIALALQSSLSNIASGILILFSHPFKVGDYIELENVSGTVTEILLFHTTLNTPDNKRVIVPNSRLTTNNITNFTAEETRRLDLEFTMQNDVDLMLVKETLLAAAKGNGKVLSSPAAACQVVEQGAESVSVKLCCWVKTDDIGSAKGELLEAVRLEFEQRGIDAPRKE